MFRKLGAWINRARERSKKFFNSLDRFRSTFYWIKSAWFWVLVWIIFVIVVGEHLAIKNWNWLAGSESGGESGGAIIRNLALTFVAVIGLPFVFWRSWVAERQAETAQRGLLNERYQKGAEMLGSTDLTVRLGGIYALERLAAEHPRIYHVQVIKLLCMFVRDQTEAKEKIPALGSETWGDGESTNQIAKPRFDIDAVLETIGARSQKQKGLEAKAKFGPNLDGADLRKQSFWGGDFSGLRFMSVNLSRTFLIRTKFSGASFYNADLSRVVLAYADLSRASLEDTNLSSAYLIGADFSGANLKNADLSDAALSRAILEGADITGANISGTKFSSNDAPAIGLTQKQIDSATVKSAEAPPIIEGLIDAETGEPIVWKG